MKKYLPVLLMALLVFAGCQSKTATYKKSKDGKNLIENAQSFVAKVTENAESYSAEDWNAVLDEFGIMCKDYQANKWRFFDKDREAFGQVLVDFVSATDLANDPELPLRVKQVHRQICE